MKDKKNNIVNRQFDVMKRNFKIENHKIVLILNGQGQTKYWSEEVSKTVFISNLK